MEYLQNFTYENLKREVRDMEDKKKKPS